MKQGGAFLAVLLAISGVLHLTGSGGSQQTSSGDSAADKKKKPHPQSAYVDDLHNTIQEFYGVWESDQKSDQKKVELQSHWNVPDARELAGNGNVTATNPREDTRFVIAILPDPLHTRLALVFDRSIEAIQEAAERDHYSFDRAIFPWDRAAPPQPDDVVKRREAAEVQKEREAYPGLLIFRGLNRDAAGNPVESPASLFVFVVGETPTSGIRKLQFQHALDMMKEIRYGKDAPDPHSKPRPLLILGPNSSGSLRSLKRELKLAANPQAFVYSGTITDAASMYDFTTPQDPTIQFASFQDNDDYIRDRFVDFACHDGYDPSELATLSEGDTAYGSGVQGLALSSTNASDRNVRNATAVANSPNNQTPASAPPVEPDAKCANAAQNVVHLRFPREISYFRAAYQDKSVSESKSASDIPVPRSSSVTLSPEEIGTDDDAALPYAGAQTPAAQEAVMLGIVTELNKHHTKFTILYASDPLDQYFLARYLRTKYPRGRVVVTTPDLLLTSQADGSLRGVLGINTYPIVAGLNDAFCVFSEHDKDGPTQTSHLVPPQQRLHRHDDRLFVSSGSIGTFNAMLGLLAQLDITGAGVASHVNTEGHSSRALVPPAPYAEYSTPQLLQLPVTQAQFAGSECGARPLVWLTILGEDGFWPIAGLSDQEVRTVKREEPILAFNPANTGSTVPDVDLSGTPKITLTPPSLDVHLRLPPAWRITYCLALFLLFMHAYLSLNGSMLADSEAKAQFARIDDWRDATVISLGAFALKTAFVAIVFSGGPVITALGPRTVFWFWLPCILFSAITFYDLGWLRKQRRVAGVYLVSVFVMVGFQLLAWLNARDLPSCWVARAGYEPSAAVCDLLAPLGKLHTAYWSTRLLHYTSGVSPVLPILFLAGAAYWWMWQSLRGVTLVDRRRPRLPVRSFPVARWYRINDREATEVRKTAHPFFFKWPIVLIVLVAALFLMTVLDLRHPVQTVEAGAYGWTYTLLLSLMVATLLGVLLKLVFTWLKCSQILTGLDRLPIRDAFSRMKHLSWHSFWNPGGSTLRATYKVLQRGLDCLERLHCVLFAIDKHAPMDRRVRRTVQVAIADTFDAVEIATSQYSAVLVPGSGPRTPLSRIADSLRVLAAKQPFYWSESVRKARTSSYNRIADFLEGRVRQAAGLPKLMNDMETLQVQMAQTAALIVDGILSPWWEREKAPVVSEDKRLKKEKLPLTRALAEEFVALVYVNFLITVLLRIRTMVVASIGMYVFIVLSMNVYPFEPHPALQTLAVVLLAVMGAAVAYVYAQMHRDPVLSRLTSTASGELGWDFWLKLASAGAIPVFSLLAVQFPEINRFLFSWLEPALQAVK